MKVKIEGPLSAPIIDGIDFGAMSTEEHKKNIFKDSPHNYSQIPGWMVKEVGDEDCTLVLTRTVNGKEEVQSVLDFQTMYSVYNLGYGKHGKRIRDEVIKHLMSGLPAIPRAMDHPLHAPALKAIRGFTGLDEVLMKSGGVETVETACNIASYFSGRPWFISAKECFHGRSRFARSLSSSPSARNGFEPLFENVRHIPFGDIESLRQALVLLNGMVAAVILEPIQGEGGVNVPPDGYFKAVRELCDEYEILLILDEIQTGFGRTGTDWAFEHEGIKPDLLCGGKAAGGGIFPVSFVAGTKEVMSVIKPGKEGATWSATPVQCIAVMAAIRELSDNNFSERSKEKGALLMRLLKKTARKHPKFIKDIRGRGLFIGVETIFDGGKLSKRLLGEGVWAKETGEDGLTLRFSPPLTITDDQIHEAVLAFDRTLEHLIREV